MATLTPLRTSRPTSVGELGRWLRQVLDRPLTSYHLVLGATALLLIVGVMMVLSASSVNAYLNTGDSYYYVKRQLIFLGVGLVGMVVIAKLPPPTLAAAELVRHGAGGAAVDLDVHPARDQRERQPELALPRL